MTSFSCKNQAIFMSFKLFSPISLFKWNANAKSPMDVNLNNAKSTYKNCIYFFLNVRLTFTTFTNIVFLTPLNHKFVIPSEGLTWGDYTGQQNETFFLYWYETSRFCIILGRWFWIRHPFFAITSKFRSIANFMVGRSENQFFAFCEKTIRDIENLNAYRRFEIKFCAF